MIGFNPQPPQRRPVYSTAGQKIGYIANGNLLQNVRGQTVAKILRYKPNAAPNATAHACGGAMLPVNYRWEA